MAAAKPVKAAPAPKPASAPKAPASPRSRPNPAQGRGEAESNGKAKKDVKKETKQAPKPAKPAPAAETVPLMSAFKPPFAMPSFAMPKAMMPLSLTEAGQGAADRQPQARGDGAGRMASSLDFAMRLSTVKTPMES